MKNKVTEQYKIVGNFNLRGVLHSFNINKIDWNNWCFSQMQFPLIARILELGCGTGYFWGKNIYKLKSEWNITLSNFSKVMLESSQEKLEQNGINITYKVINAQDIPYEV